MRNSNYDCFQVEPGSHQKMFCGLCNKKMDLIPFDPDKFKGKHGMGAAIMRKYYNFDEFICPNSDLEWHINALELMHAIDKSPSRTLRDILRKDYEKIVNDNATG